MTKLGKNIDFYRGQWRARIVIPVELRPFILKKDGTPRTSLEEGLGADPKVALKRSHAALARFHDILDYARERLERDKPTLASAAKAFYRDELALDDQERAGGARTVANPLFAPQYATRLRLLVAGRLDDDESEALVGYAADSLIERSLVSVSTVSERRELLRALAEVRLDTLALSQSRDKGELVDPAPKSALVTAADPAPLTPPTSFSRPKTKKDGLTLTELLQQFLNERKDIAPNTKKEREVAVRMLSGFLGEQKPVRSITKDDMIAYKNALIETPANCQQRFPGMTIPQAIKANAKREAPYPALNPKTINNKWLMHVGTMFNWARDNRLMDDNPAERVRVDTGKGFKEPTRVPFTPDDIKAIFSDEFFQEEENYGSRHWALLLALYTGARSSSEIRRVKLADIYTEQGVDVIDLVEATKNIQSKRIVPIHKDLISLGFLEYVERLRKEGKQRLFWDWEPGDKINRWFLRTYKQKVGIDDRRKVFHSFRHTLKTALARYGVNRDVSDLITGHKDQSVAGIYISNQAVTMIQAMDEGLKRVEFGVIPLLARRQRPGAD